MCRMGIQPGASDVSDDLVQRFEYRRRDTLEFFTSEEPVILGCAGIETRCAPVSENCQIIIRNSFTRRLPHGAVTLDGVALRGSDENLIPGPQLDIANPDQSWFFPPGSPRGRPHTLRS